VSVVADELVLLIRAEVGQALAGMQAVETKSGNMSGGLKKAGGVAKKALMGFGLAAAGTALVAGKMFVDFEKGMAQIEALVGVPKAEMKELEGAALGMGKQFGVSAKEASEGLFFLKSAGLETSVAISTLEETAKASAMGLGTMEELANTATTAMTNFGLDGTGAFDRIAMAAKLAKADPAALGKIMNENSASAALVNMSYDDMAGTLALLTRKFGDANKAGTGMGGILRKLVKPSEMAIEKLREIGVSSEEFKRMMAEDLPGSLQKLDAAFAANGTSQTEWMGKVFEDGEAIKAAAAVIGTSGAEISEIYGQMGQAQGTLEDGWAIMEDTAAVKFSKMKESIKSGLIPLGETIVEAALPAMQEFSASLGGMVENIGPAAKVIGEVLVKVFKVAADYISLVSRGITSLGAIFGDEGSKQALRYAESMDYLNKKLSEGADPALALANAAMNLAREGDLTKEAFDAMTAAAGLTDEGLANVKATMMGYAETTDDANISTREMKDAFGIAADEIHDSWNVEMEAAAAAVGDLGESVVDLGDDIGPSMQQIAAANADSIAGMIDDFGKIPDAIELSAAELLENLTISSAEYEQYYADLAEAEALGFTNLAAMAQKMGPEYRDILREAVTDPSLGFDLERQYASFGTAATSGLAAGLTSPKALADLAAANATVAARATSSMRKELDIRSPSRVMAKMVGVPMTQGIAMGMKSPAAMAGFKGISNDVLSAVRVEGGGTTTHHTDAQQHISVTMQGGDPHEVAKTIGWELMKRGAA
jgi:TP901 family phage tail tape measure protein